MVIFLMADVRSSTSDGLFGSACGVGAGTEIPGEVDFVFLAAVNPDGTLGTGGGRSTALAVEVVLGARVFLISKALVPGFGFGRFI
jgi:hypothetical protein